MKEVSTSNESLLSITPITRAQKTVKSTSAITIEKLDNLVPFEGHPFNLYEGQRFLDMVESVRANGVLVPIVVRPYAKEEGKYEILSGHNRVAAAKEAGISGVPAIIRRGLTDEEALLIVTETNLIQRSFADLKHSERAVVLATHYEAMKKKSGYRSDLLADIEELSGVPLGHGSRTRDKISAQYGLGKTTVARYLRVNKLLPALKARLDKNEIGMRVAEALSFLKTEEQEILEELLAGGKKITIKQADVLKEKSEARKLNKKSILEIFKPEYFDQKVRPVKLSEQFLSKHFKPDQSPDEIEKVISDALEIYYLNQKKV